MTIPTAKTEFFGWKSFKDDSRSVEYMFLYFACLQAEI